MPSRSVLKTIGKYQLTQEIGSGSIGTVYRAFDSSLEKEVALKIFHTVPDVARYVNDPEWPGTGNWAFNMAFAGAHNGLHAYVTRLSDVSELEEWIGCGVPVAVSVSYSALRGEPKPDSGHLVVCVGFTKTGDIVVNDPGRSQVRQIYTRPNLVRAWRHSENTVYLIYPQNHSMPPDRFGHWLQSTR